MTLKSLFNQAKILMCPKGYITKDNRTDILFSVFNAAKKNGMDKELCRSCLSALEKEILGDVKKIPKEKRQFIIDFTRRDVERCFFEVYGYDIEVLEAPSFAKEEKEEEKLDTSRMVDEDYIKKKGIKLGPPMSDFLDVDFCRSLGIKNV